MAFGALTKRGNPWNEFMEIQNEMNRLFESTFGTSRERSGLISSDFLPAVDVLRNEEHILVRADLPGVSKQDIELSVLNGRLFIRGEKTHEHEEKEQTAHRRERFYGRFERVIDLPAPVISDQIKAKFTDGVLEIMAPISDDARPRRIAVDVQ